MYEWKTRLCFNGSNQVKHQDCWGKYNPVVTLETIRTLLTLSILDNWHTKQVDFVLAFPAKAWC